MVKTSKKYILRLRAVNRGIFEAIRSGKKRVETRAATKKYEKIQTGDTAVFVCGDDKFEKTIKSVKIFKGIPELLKKYRVAQINPLVKSAEELEKTYYSFPNYRDKIKRHGLIALELKP